MKTWNLINLGLFIGCVVVSFIAKNYAATAGWFCACLLQIMYITKEQDND